MRHAAQQKVGSTFSLKKERKQVGSNLICNQPNARYLSIANCHLVFEIRFYEETVSPRKLFKVSTMSLITNPKIYIYIFKKSLSSNFDLLSLSSAVLGGGI